MALTSSSTKNFRGNILIAVLCLAIIFGLIGGYRIYLNLFIRNFYRAIWYGSSSNNKYCVKLIANNQWLVNKKNSSGHSPLFVASCRGNEQVMKALLHKGADPNTSDYYGNTPLHFMAKQRNYPMVKMLLHYGANPNMSTQHHETPLALACKTIEYPSKNNVEIIKELLAAGADPNIGGIGPNNDPPLFRAILWKNEELVSLLLAKGADVNHKNALGIRPLDRAIRTENYPIVKQLIQHGAIIVYYDSESMNSPIFTAIQSNVYDVVSLLIKNHGNVPKA